MNRPLSICLSNELPGIRVERCNVPAVSRGTVRNTDKDGLFHVEHQQVAPVWDCFTWNRERLI